MVIMGGISSEQRRFWYPKIVKNQGGSFCKGCGKRVYYDEDIEAGHPLGVIDHIDNKRKPHINKIDNLQILCRSCNRIKNPRKPFLPPIQQTASEVKNKECEKPFREWIFSYVLQKGEMPFKHAHMGGAEKFSCNPETTRKYLGKMTSPEGLYAEVDGFLVFKSDEEIDKIIEDESVLTTKVDQ